MKIILQILAITICVSGISFASETTNWVLIARSANDKYFYIDSSTLSYQVLKSKLEMNEEQIATAWFKIVPNKQRKKAVNMAEQYINEEVGYSTALIQTNCANSKFRVLIINLFNKKGDIAHRIETLISKFEDIPPGTVYEDIKEIICR
ncbi:MAG: hypothetical protein HQL08_12735 [Nitrospirae bacterium]|nr:hypothetical protein [Nitrospirota bacterium]